MRTHGKCFHDVEILQSIVHTDKWLRLAMAIFVRRFRGLSVKAAFGELLLKIAMPGQ
jgi:hypothetical protein